MVLSHDFRSLSLGVGLARRVAGFDAVFLGGNHVRVVELRFILLIDIDPKLFLAIVFSGHCGEKTVTLNRVGHYFRF